MYRQAIALMLAVNQERGGPGQITFIEMAMLQTWVLGQQFGWNGDDWSVSAEAFRYVALPRAAVRVSRLGDRVLVLAMV